MGKKWSEEAVLRNRRKRMARRLYKRIPMFAVDEIKGRFNIEYSETDLFSDQILKKPSNKRPGKRTVPNGKVDYLLELKNKLHLALENQDEVLIGKILSRYYLIQNNRAKDWSVMVLYGDTNKVFYFPSRFPAKDILGFVKNVNECLGSPDAKKRIDRIYELIFDSKKHGG